MFFQRLNIINSIICDICLEPNNSDQIRCQNCRARLSYENNRLNPINQIYGNILTNRFSIAAENDLNVFPDREELKEEVMTLKLYIKGEDGNLEAPLCCICQENIVKDKLIYKLPCNHFFHKFCARKWFKEKKECPYCRKDFKLYFI